jgi:hypothetical protein
MCVYVYTCIYKYRAENLKSQFPSVWTISSHYREHFSQVIIISCVNNNLKQREHFRDTIDSTFEKLCLALCLGMVYEVSLV